MRYPLLLILGMVILLALKDDEFRLTDCYVKALCFAPGLISETLGYMQNGIG